MAKPRPTPPAGSPGGVRYDPWIEHLAWLMDSSIGIGRWSIGIDGLLGLVPGFGDLAGAVVSMAIVMRAVRAGVPRVAIARMVVNIAIDALLGAVPLAGDLFDFAYKANLKNFRIYHQSLEAGGRGTARYWGFFALLAAGLLAVLSVPVLVAVLLIRAFAGGVPLDFPR